LIDHLEEFSSAYKNPRALELFGKNTLVEDEILELGHLVGLNPEDGHIVKAVDHDFRESLISNLVNSGDLFEFGIWQSLDMTKKIFLGHDDPLMNCNFVKMKDPDHV